MLAALPLLQFILLYFSICYLLKNKASFRRESFILAAVGWSACIVLPLEILNFSKNITLPFLTAYWILLSAGTAGLLMRVNKDNVRLFPFSFKSLPPFEKFQLIIIAAIMLLTWLTAFMSAPNSWDTLNYHMSRVAFWTQNGSINHYPTPEFRQLYFQPWVEYAALHFQILSGTDRLANLICWFGYVGSVIGAGFLVSLFGSDRRTQILTMLLCATVPTLIIEAPSMRVSPVVAMFAICFVILLMLFKKEPSFYLIVFAGGALGVGLLTKGTMYLVIAPFVVWFVFVIFKKVGISKAIFYLLIFGAVAILINAGFFIRNYYQVQDVLGPASMRKWGLTEELSPGLVFSNILRTIVYQLGNPINQWNDWLVGLVKNIHEALNINIIDPRSTASATPFHVAVSTYEDSVTNFLQVLLWLIGIPALLWSALKKKEGSLVTYLICLLAAFVSVAVMIKWTNQATRYFCAHYALASVAAGIFIERFFRKKAWVVGILVLTFSLTAIPYVFRNNMRRLVSTSKQTVFNTTRMDQYFRMDSSLIPPYTSAVNAVKSMECDQIGLYMGFNRWDYPLFVLLDKAIPGGYRTEHLVIHETAPAEYPLGPFSPCAVIVVDYPGNKPLIINKVQYDMFQDFGKAKVYK